MKKFDSFEEAVAAKADAHALAHYVVDTVSSFSDGRDVQFDFLARDAVGTFCLSLGITRNWAELELDAIAPPDEFDVNVVPIAEASEILGLLAALVRDKYLHPRNEGKPVPTLLNDFLQEPSRFQDKKTYGHLDEFAYALAVELEHGRDRGANVTMNHPLLTGMVVMAHLSEDSLYYARLRVMEAEGELLHLQLEKKPFKQIHAHLETLADAQRRLHARIAEKIADA